jgi:hypothetical protein
MYYNEFTNRLLDREEIIWSGRPATGLLFTGQDIFLIPFSLLWGGIVLFGAFATLTQTKEQPGFPALFLIPFVLIGIYLIVGRFIVDAWLRTSTRYALTNKRILILRAAPFGKFTALNLDRLPEMSLSESANGRGTLRFGPQAQWWSGRGNNFSGWSPSLDPTPQFIAIENARSVFDQIQRATQRAA